MSPLGVVGTAAVPPVDDVGVVVEGLLDWPAPALARTRPVFGLFSTFEVTLPPPPLHIRSEC